MTQGPTGIVMMNLGGPKTLEDVRPFLLKLFEDREIIQLPAQRFLGPYIARRRTKSVAQKYDEIGGGSLRIHSREVQERVFAVMGLEEEEAQEKFGFLLDAFGYGAPPHGGIALGWDRVVMLLAGAESIREVIAFPKSGGGYDPLTSAPAPITAQQRREAGVDAVVALTRAGQAPTAGPDEVPTDAS